MKTKTKETREMVDLYGHLFEREFFVSGVKDGKFSLVFIELFTHTEVYDFLRKVTTVWPHVESWQGGVGTGDKSSLLKYMVTLGNLSWQDLRIDYKMRWRRAN